MWMSRSVGIRVFPTQISERIRTSPSLIHYSIPSEEQQYTFRNFKQTTDFDGTITDCKSTNNSLDATDNESAGGLSKSKFVEEVNLEDQKQQSSSSSGTAMTAQTRNVSCNQKQSQDQNQRLRKNVKTAASKPTTDKASDALGSQFSTTLKPSQTTTNVVYTNDIQHTSLGFDNDKEEFEILKDLDNALAENEQMTFDELRQKNMNLTFRQYAYYKDEYPELTEESPPQTIKKTKPEQQLLSEKPLCIGALKRTRKPHKPHMDGEKTDKYGSNMSAPMLNNDVIGELNRLPNGINSLSRYKQEQRQKVNEREQEARMAVEKVERTYTPEMFMDQTPKCFKDTENPIPQWKRLLMAKKICESAKKKKIEEIWNEFYAWKQKFTPNFKRTLTSKPAV